MKQMFGGPKQNPHGNKATNKRLHPGTPVVQIGTVSAFAALTRSHLTPEAGWKCHCVMEAK